MFQKSMPLLSLVTAGGIALAVSLYASQTPSTSTPAETTFARVMREGVLRCAYYVFPPITTRDAETKTLSGLGVDMMERIGKNAGIKIEWAEEIDFGNWQPGLKAKRFDAVCTPIWPDPSMAREALFTRSMFYAGVNAYVRGSDHRFDNNLAAINDPGVTIAAQESTFAVTIAQDYFPKAKLWLVPQNAPAGSVAQSVLAKKADVVLWDENGVHEMLKANPGSLRNADPHRPLKVMPFELMTRPEDSALRDWLNTGLENLEDTGVTNLLLDKWETVPGSFYRMAKPYMLPAK